MKTYTKNTNSRVNISYSLAKKVQYKTALRLLTKRGFEDDVKATKVTEGSIQEKVREIHYPKRYSLISELFTVIFSTFGDIYTRK